VGGRVSDPAFFLPEFRVSGSARLRAGAKAGPWKSGPCESSHGKAARESGRARAPPEERPFRVRCVLGSRGRAALQGRVPGASKVGLQPRIAQSAAPARAACGRVPVKKRPFRARVYWVDVEERPFRVRCVLGSRGRATLQGRVPGAPNVGLQPRIAQSAAPARATMEERPSKSAPCKSGRGRAAL
jgi:hypothetical protein